MWCGRPCFALSALGLLLIVPGPARARLWLFLGVVLLASAVGLVRLHATTGYCTVRHGLIPGTILLLAAAHGASWLIGRLYLSGKWLGLNQERLSPGPAVWALLLVLIVIVPRIRDSGPAVPGPFHAYRDAGDWLAQNSRDSERVLDLTDWSLYFSQKPGYRFAQVYHAPADPRTRWVVARDPSPGGPVELHQGRSRPGRQSRSCRPGSRPSRTGPASSPDLRPAPGRGRPGSIGPRRSARNSPAVAAPER